MDPNKRVTEREKEEVEGRMKIKKARPNSHLESTSQRLQAFLVQSPDRLREVAERRRVGEVEGARLVVLDHPREHRVLRQVVQGPTRRPRLGTRMKGYCVKSFMDLAENQGTSGGLIEAPT